VRNKTKLENPNPILQNKNRSRVRERRSVPTSFEKKCSLKQKHSGSHTKHSLVPTTSPLLSPSTIKKKKKREREKKKEKTKANTRTVLLCCHYIQSSETKAKANTTPCNHQRKLLLQLLLRQQSQPTATFQRERASKIWRDLNRGIKEELRFCWSIRNLQFFFYLISKLLEREKQEEERVSAVCLSLNRISRYKILILSLLFFFKKRCVLFIHFVSLFVLSVSV